MSIIWSLIIGLIAGYLANLCVKGKGAGFWINLLLGIVGGWFGGWIFGKLGIHIFVNETLEVLLTGFIGAVVLIFLWRLIFGKRKK